MRASLCGARTVQQKSAAADRGKNRYRACLIDRRIKPVRVARVLVIDEHVYVRPELTLFRYHAVDDSWILCGERAEYFADG